jgi:hypothetical protein
VLERGDGTVGVDAPLDEPAELLAAVLVDDVEQLQDLAVRGLIELEVEGPDVVGSLGPEAVGGTGRGPQALALSPAICIKHPFNQLLF